MNYQDEMGVSLFFCELNFLFFLLSIFILIDDGRCFAIVFSDEDKEGGERKREREREGKLEEELGRKKQTNQAKHFSPAKKKKRKKESPLLLLYLLVKIWLCGWINIGHSRSTSSPSTPTSPKASRTL